MLKSVVVRVVQNLIVWIITALYGEPAPYLTLIDLQWQKGSSLHPLVSSFLSLYYCFYLPCFVSRHFHFQTFPVGFWIPIIFSNLNCWINLQEQVEKVFCFKNYSLPFTDWNCSSDWKTFWNWRLKAENLKKNELTGIIY